MLARMYNDGFANRVQYLFVHAGPRAWSSRPLLVEAGLLFVTGLWLLVRLRRAGHRAGPGAGRPVAGRRPRRDLRASRPCC